MTKIFDIVKSKGILCACHLAGYRAREPARLRVAYKCFRHFIIFHFFFVGSAAVAAARSFRITRRSFH